MIYKLFQKLPLFKGKLRLAKLFVYNKHKQKEFTIDHGLIITVPNLIENVSFELFINGSYEKNIIDLICKELPLNGIYIDVGANIGAIALVVAKKRPDVQIFAFEAAPSVFEYLELNKINNKLNNLNVINKAIHILDNEMLSFFSPSIMNGKGSFASVFTKESVLVNTISLDTFLSTSKLIPDIIKIDVEGFELLVFESMLNFLQSINDCKLIFEFVDWAEALANLEPGSAQSFLLNLNYKLLNIDNGKLIAEPLVKGSCMIKANKNEK